MASSLKQVLTNGSLEAGLILVWGQTSKKYRIVFVGLSRAGLSMAEIKKEKRKVQYTLEQVVQDGSEHFAPIQASFCIQCKLF